MTSDKYTNNSCLRIQSCAVCNVFWASSFAAACLLGLFLSNLCFFASNYWMSVWVQADDHQAYSNTAWYFGVYALLSHAGACFDGSDRPSLLNGVLGVRHGNSMETSFALL